MASNLTLQQGTEAFDTVHVRDKRKPALRGSFESGIKSKHWLFSIVPVPEMIHITGMICRFLALFSYAYVPVIYMFALAQITLFSFSEANRITNDCIDNLRAIFIC